MKVLNQIAMNIYSSGWLDKECIKICPMDKELREDLYQEIMLIVLTFKPAGALQSAYAKGEHLPFIKKIIMNQFNSATSPFYTKYRKNIGCELNEEITGNLIMEEEDND